MDHCMDCGAPEHEKHHHNCAVHEQDFSPFARPVSTIAQDSAQEEPIRLFVAYLGPSTNAIYAGIHWAQRKKAKDSACQAVADAVEAAGLTQVAGRVDLVFRPRLGKGARRRDTSNNSMSAKLIEDALVKAGVLADDTEEHVRRVIHEPAEIDRSAETGTWIEIIPVRAEAA